MFDASTGETTRLTNISSSEKLMRMLSNGGCWYEDDFEARGSKSGGHILSSAEAITVLKNYPPQPTATLKTRKLVLLPYAASVSQSHQLMSKLDKESDRQRTRQRRFD